ncbi:Rne/Rng family ribonuclease [Caldinitratiruptor microaerophilus]|uniref:Ribonuclease G n=1 Tax=Caldinitratiruptor microaerophilus TaxID=671077 RepID=A0AA35CPJ7_9FIRM|nr:Rne/Rng family ribonuclease [Caldinitratiruptor microaerophilus]BDG61466.1 ribonuclease G [Caldinitratiruptor microaerophilus]
MSKEILVSVDVDGVRAAMREDGQVVELLFERAVRQQLVGNIYKGRVQNVLPGMQAAFVDIGLERNAFLFVDDAIPPGLEVDGAPPAIRDVVRPGQELLVQVVKEPSGTKGPRVTRHVTLPGRYLVLMPSVEFVGVSRRITKERERERLKALAESLRPPGMGLIVRTVAEGASEAEFRRDIEYLVRLWQGVEARARAAEARSLVHRDLGLVQRVVRDWLDDDVTELYIDSPSDYERVLEWLELMAPHLRSRVRLYTPTTVSLFDRYGVEQEIERALRRKVWLRSGGYLVIDRTEALTAIDVNTGKFVGTTDLRDTVLRTNLEAAAEIARQLRLRDIGGIVVVDFIDMDLPEDRQRVLEALEEALARDRTRTNVLGLTQLGLVELTRKKSRQTLDEILLRPCPHCDGRGRVPAEDTLARRARAEIRRTLLTSAAEAILVELHPSVAALVIGPGGAHLRQLERELGRSIFVRGNSQVDPGDLRIRALGSLAEVEAQALPVRPGQVLTVTVEEPHVTNPGDGIARLDGYVIDIDGAGGMVGRQVQVEVVRAFRTYARARLV